MEKEFSWKGSYLVRPCVDQTGTSTCGYIAVVRETDAVMRQSGWLRPDEELSIQGLINKVPLEKTVANPLTGEKRGATQGAQVIFDALRDHGTVLESVSPSVHPYRFDENADHEIGKRRFTIAGCDYHSLEEYVDTYGTVTGGRLFECALQAAIRRFPIAAAIQITSTYAQCRNGSKEMFTLPPSELVPEPGSIRPMLHMLPLVGWGVNAIGRLYWLGQESYGPNCFDDGYVRIAWHYSIVKHFFVVRLPPVPPPE